MPQSWGTISQLSTELLTPAFLAPQIETAVFTRQGVGTTMHPTSCCQVSTCAPSARVLLETSKTYTAFIVLEQSKATANISHAHQAAHIPNGVL